MDETILPRTPRADEQWPLRPVILGALGLASALAVHLILGNDTVNAPSITALVLATFVTAAAGLTGFTLERERWPFALVFSVGAAAVAAAVIHWNGNPAGWNAAEGWRVVSLILAIGIAAPLFQAARDEGMLRFPYAAVHDHAWTNAVLWCATWAFVGIVFALTWLLSALFGLIKINLLSDLLRETWFLRVLLGTSFGAGLGLLRERDSVVRLLQRVVATVLAVLAPVLAVGLILFLGALPFTGLDALWDAWLSATPTLLACIIGALILSNAVVGNSPEQESRMPLLRYGATGLAVVMLPMALLAAVAVYLRIHQYGFTPERLWAVTFVVVAIAYGAAYLAAVALGGPRWAERVRPYNLVLAMGLCGLALLLATPLISFNAISTRDQVARLESGKLAPEKFDWAALAFDFGEPGKKALERLKKSANAKVRERALAAGKAESRGDVPQFDAQQRARERVASQLRLLPQGTTLTEELRSFLAQTQYCGSENNRCTVVLLSPDAALFFRDHCYEDIASSNSSGFGNFHCGNPERFYRIDGKWGDDEPGSINRRSQAERQAMKEAFEKGEIEIRTVSKRQAFVGGVPVGEPID